MRNFLTVLAFLLVMTACTGAVYPGQTPSLSDPAVARLVINEDGEEAGHCTVFKVDDDLAMTAGHCCEHDEDVVRTYHAEGSHAIYGAGFEALQIDAKHDVCVMKGRLKGASLALAPFDPTVGARVWTAGYPKGKFLISEGFWAGREDDEGYGVASIAVYGGASGSPVLDVNNNVVGILVAYYPPMTNMALVSNIEWLRTNLLLAK